MKKNNYAYFAAIRADDLETVKAMTAASPEIVNIPAPKKPADTRGMSPLQAALCTGWHRDIAWFLLEHGADVNFCADAKLDGYPVLFDAVNIAIWNARRHAWDGQDTTPMRLVWKHTRAEADEAFAFLQRVLALGADVRRTDQYGRGVLMEAMEETSRLCPVLNTETGEYYPGRPSQRRCAAISAAFSPCSSPPEPTAKTARPTPARPSASTTKTPPHGPCAPICLIDRR